MGGASNVGYELEVELYDPPRYWLHRIKNGRRTERRGPFDSERQLREEHRAQLGLDRDDELRSRMAPPKRERH
jgi:hypothetical protein